MMLAKREWFGRRKYGGWGLRPRTWQGWVYVGVVLAPFAVFQMLPFWSDGTRLVVTVGWLVFLMVDVTRLMVGVAEDERERKIEALAERNAAWVMMLTLVVGLLYQLIGGALAGTVKVDGWLMAALAGGVVAKSASNYWLGRRSL